MGGSNDKFTTEEVGNQDLPMGGSNDKFTPVGVNQDLPTFTSPFIENQVARCAKNYLDTNILFLKQNILGKPKWYEKIQDDVIVNKWRREAASQMSAEQINFVIDWLRYDVAQRSGNTILSSPVDAVYTADLLIPDELKSSFIKNAKVLEGIPERERDYHPGSDNTVLDLVHPSLFCLVYDLSQFHSKLMSQRTTPMYQWIGAGSVIKSTQTTKDPMSSSKFQWLPSEISVDKLGKVTWESYINNLHPYKHRDLYVDLAKILGRFIPVWERCLSETFESDNIQDIDMYDLWAEPTDSQEEDDDFMDTRPMKPIVFNQRFSPKTPKTIVNLKGRKLQVIVKMANIELTPQNPKYNGGTWHVEGMKNENIVATGIYYYSMNNITQTNIKFRQAVEEDVPYEQNDTRGVEEVFGLHADQALNQFLGEVTLSEDKCIAFPNIYQHQVSPFKLKDPNQPGHRKILVFFLINPKTQILSTGHVPPQQDDWFVDSLYLYGALTPLPKDLLRIVVSFMGCPMDLQTTKSFRTTLMDERKFIQAGVEEGVFLREFSLCEH